MQRVHRGRCDAARARGPRDPPTAARGRAGRSGGQRGGTVGGATSPNGTNKGSVSGRVVGALLVVIAGGGGAGGTGDGRTRRRGADIFVVSEPIKRITAAVTPRAAPLRRPSRLTPSEGTR